MMRHKIYYVLGGFPVVSQSFLYNQISQVLKEGQFDVKILVLNKKKGNVHPIYAQLNAHVQHLPSGREKGAFHKLKLILRSTIRLALRKPMLLLKSINVVKYGREAANGSYIIRAEQFSRLDPDLLHCHFGTTARIAADLKDMGAVNCRMISSFHGKDITVYPRQFGQKFYARLFATPGRFTGNSHYIIDKMKANGCPPEQIVRIPMCLDTASFPFREVTPPRQVLQVLTVGRFVEKKGYRYALEAMALLKEAGVSFMYLTIGEGPLLEAMKAFAGELGIADQVVFHGAMQQEGVQEQYRAAHVFLLASVTAANGDTEGQGLVLQEAQASGLPVVATLHNGFPDSILEDVTGFLVPEKDPQALFEKLLLLANDPARCADMAVCGRQFVEQHFDSAVIGARLKTEYLKLLEE